jgi:hypothetical protein
VGLPERLEDALAIGALSPRTRVSIAYHSWLLLKSRGLLGGHELLDKE